MIKYYKVDIADDIPSFIKRTVFYKEWYEITKDILLNNEFQKRKLFPHHHNTSVWDHSVLVSFNAFVIAKYYNADARVCAIAGLLHDFYPWSWIYNEDLEELDKGYYLNYRNTKHKFFKQHGFIHGKEASINYTKYFPELENKKITKIIERHMFPLTLKPPTSKEGMIICAVDKLNSLHELPEPTQVLKDFYYKRVANLFRRVDTK